MTTKKDVGIEKIVKDQVENDTSSVLHHFLTHFVFDNCLLCVC